MTKYCNKCNTEKPISDFHKRGTKHQCWCKSCISEFHKAKRLTQVVKRNEKKYEQEKQRKLIIEQNIVAHLKANPCSDCGEPDILVLDFDHLRDKEHNISTMVRDIKSWKTIEKEIAKCQVLCSNCHRRKSAKQLNNWKLNYI